MSNVTVVQQTSYYTLKLISELYIHLIKTIVKPLIERIIYNFIKFLTDNKNDPGI